MLIIAVHKHTCTCAPQLGDSCSLLALGQLSSPTIGTALVASNDAQVLGKALGRNLARHLLGMSQLLASKGVELAQTGGGRNLV